MSTDLSAAIRAALHTDDISESDLRQPTMLDAPPRRTGTRLAVVVAVALLSGVIAVLLPHHDDSGPAGGSAGLAGFRWRVVQIRDQYGMHFVPADLHARVAYTHDDYVLGNDDLNALQGRYVTTPSGYTVRDSASTLVGGTGGVTVRSRVSAAVDAMFFSTDGHTSVSVDAILDGRSLTLHHGAFTLTLHRGKAQSDFTSDLPSPTPPRPS